MEVRETIPVGPSAPAIARHALADIASMPDSTMRSAQLLVSELVTHRVRCASAERQDVLGLDASLTPRCLRVEVTDDGLPNMAGRDPDQPAVSWELQVVAELADRWGLRHDTQTTLWFELDL